MSKKRKDSKNRVLRKGEYEKATGYEYKWTDIRGKRHSRFASTLEKLREIEKEIQKDFFSGQNNFGDKTTLNEVYYRWRNIKRGLRKHTFRNYCYLYERFVEEEFGKTKIKDLTRSEIRQFYNFLADEKQIKVSSIDSIHTVVHQVLEVAIDDDLLRYNPSDNAMTELKKSGKNTSEKRKALTLEEQKIFEDFLKTSGKFKSWYPIFTVMLWTGLRVGEVTALRWEDVDFENSVISVKHSLVLAPVENKGYLAFSMNEPKTKAGLRKVPMSDKVKEAFLIEKKRQEDEGIVCKSVIDGFTNFIFLNRFGKVQHQGALNKVLHRVVKACNDEILSNNAKSEECVLVPPISNHILRHTFITRMNDANINPKVIAQIVGHSEIGMTMNVYTDAFENKIKSEFQSFDEYYS